ncbi:FAD-binding oxidoreductase [Actinobacteria bacterium YIM 96077]|uniref:FAD-binding oxidoreductase n=1 Tax=Phytoactinopolyspora halophila TaxID=1981511 RepID=UPI000F4DA26A|nr:FAD-binding oxidoreductase [Phytoactinopolyspora halophila]AYY13880.1 FAD-binding oxidoreductase [Actinobacteria bacterium YIM 96077]
MMHPEAGTVAEAQASYRPAELAGAREAVLAARQADTNVLVRGSGSKLRWGARPAGERPWSVIDTRALNRLIHHEPGDMTATVQAGMPLHELQEQLAVAGQELAVDPPRAARGATVGGVYVANDAGPRRLAYGGIRDLVIGTTVVLADGTVGRSGGTVIKNVAGYDLNRLWCGSLGTLALVVEMTVRLHPRPEASRTVLIPASAGDATAFVLDVLASPVECALLEWSAPAPTQPQDPLIMNTNRPHRSISVHDQRGQAGGGGWLLVGLEGRAAGLDARVDQLVDVARRHDLAAEPADGEDGLWDAWREAHAGTAGDDGAEGEAEGETVARAATLPSQLADVAGGLHRAADASGVEARLHSHAGLGLHDAIITGADPAAHAATVTAWREHVCALGGSVVVRDRPDGLDGLVDPWGEPRSAQLVKLSRSVKRALDPEGRFAPGRFLGGL